MGRTTRNNAFLIAQIPAPCHSAHDRDEQYSGKALFKVKFVEHFNRSLKVFTSEMYFFSNNFLFFSYLTKSHRQYSSAWVQFTLS